MIQVRKRKDALPTGLPAVNLVYILLTVHNLPRRSISRSRSKLAEAPTSKWLNWRRKYSIMICHRRWQCKLMQRSMERPVRLMVL